MLFRTAHLEIEVNTAFAYLRAFGREAFWDFHTGERIISRVYGTNEPN